MRLVQKVRVVLVLVLLVAMLSVSALADFDAKVFSSKMKVYFAPSTQSERIGALKQGTTFTVEAYQNGWARINYKGHIGFAKVSDMISVEPVDVAKTIRTAKITYITKADSTVRVGALSEGITVYVRGMKGEYALVSNKDFSVLGYVHSSNIK